MVRRILKIVVGALVIAGLVYFYISRLPDPKALPQLILGKWQEVGGNERLEFLRNSSMVIEKGQLRSTAMYKFVSSNMIDIKFDEWENPDDKPYQIKVTLVKDTLIFESKHTEKKYLKVLEEKPETIEKGRNVVWQKSKSNG